MLSAVGNKNKPSYYLSVGPPETGFFFACNSDFGHKKTAAAVLY
jgi:hypothetical protein